MVSALITIVYQDFKQRMINWWLPLVILVSGGWISYVNIGWPHVLSNWGINLAFLFGQWLVVGIAFGLGKKQWKFFDHLIGWGDILFLAAVAVLFSTVNFLVFYSISLLASLLGFGIYQLISRKNNITVPLAGAISICHLVFVVTIKFMGYEPWEELPIYQWTL